MCSLPTPASPAPCAIIPLMTAPTLPTSLIPAARNYLAAPSGLLLCALFLLAAPFWAGDYGFTVDDYNQRYTVIGNLSYILGQADRIAVPLWSVDRFYGISFELPLLLLERALNLDDYYYIHLLRVAFTHLFFILGGYCCYRLTYNLFPNRIIALLALLLFLLHPRLYAHSFFNTKDLPFASMLMLALYLTERAFRRDTVGAFILLGVAVGIAVNLRIMGLMLFPAVIAMRGLDLWYAADKLERRRILATAALFALTALITIYALSPYAWTNPRDYLAGALNLTVNHPYTVSVLFQGETYLSTDLPPHYSLTGFLLTTPPPALLLGVIGTAALLLAICSRPAALFRNSPLRFGCLILACFLLPLLAITLLGGSAYYWRHLFFLYAPFCVLAAVGIHWLTAARPIPYRFLRLAAGFGLTGLALALTVLLMAQLHPAQHDYFNFLTDRTTPDRLLTRYRTSPELSWPYTLSHLLNRHPNELLGVQAPRQSAAILPPAARRRLSVGPSPYARDYALNTASAAHRPDLAFNYIYRRRLFNNPMLLLRPLTDANMTPAAIAAYQRIYRDAAGGRLLTRAPYNLYLHGRNLTFVKENCQPADRAAGFAVKVYPAADQAPPGLIPPLGYHNYAEFRNLPVSVGGRCLAVFRLPDYPIAHLIAGQPDGGGRSWLTAHSFRRPGLREMTAALPPISPPPDAAAFALYRQGNALIYHRQPCPPADTAARFFLHLLPVNPADLSPERRPYGFDNRGFDFPERGEIFDGQCLAVVALPDYPIAQITTGQIDRWQTVLRLPVSLDRLRQTAAALSNAAPAARSVFDLYLRDNRLIYRRQPCRPADTAAAFFLHLVPATAADLPPQRRQYGFDSRDFDFAQYGRHFDGQCLAAVTLPDYPIAEIKTGQYHPAQGELWTAQLTIPNRAR